MENVCSVLVHMDPFHILAVDISRYMVSAVDHKTAFPLFP